MSTADWRSSQAQLPPRPGDGWVTLAHATAYYVAEPDDERVVLSPTARRALRWFDPARQAAVLRAAKDVAERLVGAAGTGQRTRVPLADWTLVLLRLDGGTVTVELVLEDNAAYAAAT